MELKPRTQLGSLEDIRALVARAAERGWVTYPLMEKSEADIEKLRQTSAYRKKMRRLGL